MKFSGTISLLTLLCVLLLACGGSETDGASTAQSRQPAPTGTASTSAQEEEGKYQQRVVWVNSLNVRKSPDPAGSILKKLDAGQIVTLTGQQSSDLEYVVLRGVLYGEPWYEIALSDTQNGWVFGGAIRGEREVKGNPPITDLQFNYPYFGDFNLESWEAGPKIDQDGADYAVYTQTFTGDGQRLQVTTGGGEYGYYINHVLLNTKGDTLRERYFTYHNLRLEIEEEVIDHMGAEVTRHVRSQSVKDPYQQLSGRPRLVNGKWATAAYDPTATSDFEL